jgi:hypothetical protein
MVKYKSVEFRYHEDLVDEINRCEIAPEQIVSITSVVRDADTYKYDCSGQLDINVRTYYVLFYWYEE